MRGNTPYFELIIMGSKLILAADLMSFATVIQALKFSNFHVKGQLKLAGNIEIALKSVFCFVLMCLYKILKLNPDNTEVLWLSS